MPPSRQPISLPVLSDPEVPLYTGHLTGQLNRHLREVARNRIAEAITGGLSKPGKMPCPAWGLPASLCRVGSSLEGTKGAVCHPDVCYAKKRNYLRQNVRDKLEERYRGLFRERDGVPLWTPSMIFLIDYLCGRSHK